MQPTEPRAVKITCTEAARLLGISPRTLEAWRRDRRGPPFFRPLIGHPFYLLSDLDAWRAAAEKVQTYPALRAIPRNSATIGDSVGASPTSTESR